MRHRVTIAIVLCMVFGFGGPAAAQDLTCPALVQSALQAADESCSALGRNQACYGNVRLTAVPQSGISDFNFAAAGDIVDVGAVKTLALSSMNASIGEWGVALLRVQANLPDTLPGQNVTFLLFGEVEIENAVPTNVEAPTPLPSPTPTILEITANNAVNVRAEPSRSGAIIGSLVAGQTLMADGRSEAGDWLRVQLTDGGPGWVFAEIVTIDGDPSLLPVVDNSETGESSTVEDAPPQPLFGAMQAFYFNTGVGDAPCAEAPDSGILIQTPQGAGTVDLLANEVAITLGSTAYLQAQAGGDMIVTVVEGQATVTALGTTVVAPAGTRVRIPLDGNRAASGPPVGPEPYDAAGLAALPLVLLPDVITVAASLTEDEIAALGPRLPNPGRYTTGGELVSDCPNVASATLPEENALALLDETGTFEFTYFPALLDPGDPFGVYFMPPITVTGVPDPQRDDVTVPTIENGAYVIERSTATPGATITQRYEVRVISDERIEGVTSSNNGTCSITLNYFLIFVESLSG